MITAEQALASMAEDIDRLQAKNLVKPGYIRRKRMELDAIRRELESAKAMADNAQAQAVRAEQAQRESDLRTGMLANVLSIIGFTPWVHLRRPIENADVYYLAAQTVTRHERERDFGRAHGWHHRGRTWWDMKQLLDNALWSARLELMLRPFQPLLNKHTAHATKEESEQHVEA